MEYDDKYVQRVINKYNRRHVIAFVQKRAEQRFLFPLGLTLRNFPPDNFGNNCNRMNPSKEFELFAALHYMKYKIAKTKVNKCRKRYLQIYLALRNRGISTNWTLVLDCSRRHAGRFNGGIDKARLIECGYVSLLHASDGFDPWRGYRFSTYACNAITRSFFNRNHVSHTISIEDVEEDIGAESVDEGAELWRERVALLLESGDLSSKEKEVLKYRFYEKLTLKEVGEMWGVTKERVRQIQVKALSRLKEELSKDPILL